MESKRNLDQQKNENQQFQIRQPQTSTFNNIEPNADHSLGLFDLNPLNDLQYEIFDTTANSNLLSSSFALDDAVLTNTRLSSTACTYSMNEWIGNEQAGTSNSSSLATADPISSAHFIPRPGNPFWGAPSSFETEDWQTFLIQYQELMKAQTI